MCVTVIWKCGGKKIPGLLYVWSLSTEIFCVCSRHQGYNIISDQSDHKQGFSESCEQSQWHAEVVPRGPQTRKPTQHDRDLAPNEKDANNKTKNKTLHQVSTFKSLF